jgi:hypothetical protein
VWATQARATAEAEARAATLGAEAAAARESLAEKAVEYERRQAEAASRDKERLEVIAEPIAGFNRAASRFFFVGLCERCACELVGRNLSTIAPIASCQTERRLVRDLDRKRQQLEGETRRLEDKLR